VVDGIVDRHSDVFHRITCFHCALEAGNYLQPLRGPQSAPCLPFDGDFTLVLEPA
jgi:hypothetical protein